METAEISILHFDDEPETVEPIAENLYYKFARMDSEWQINDGPIWTPSSQKKEAQECVIAVTSASRQRSIRIRYILVDNRDSFDNRIKALSRADIVITDLMFAPGNGPQRPVGYDLARMAVKTVPPERIVILTAFPNKLEIEMTRDPELQGVTILRKPMAAARVADFISPMVCDL